MTFLSYIRLLSASCVAAGLTVNPALAGEIKDIEFSAGQRVSLVLPDNTGADQAAQGFYLQGLMALSSGLGMQEKHSFAIERVIIGEHKPQALGIYAWPSAENADQLRSNPVYINEYEPLLHDAWKEMHTIDVDLTEDVKISFDTDKTYTMALLWFGDKAVYDSYILQSEPLREQLGAKRVFNLPVSQFDSFAATDADKSPDRVVIVEWHHSSHPDAYLNSPMLTENRPMLQQAIAKIDWYELSHWEGY